MGPPSYKRTGLAQRSRIVLAAAEGLNNTEIAARLGSAKTWRASHARRVMPQQVVGIPRLWRRQNFPSR